MQLTNDTLGQTLDYWSFKLPDADFIVYPDRDLRFSYSQFNERVNNLAKGLIYIGINPGDKIAIWAKNIPDWTTFMFAAAKIGAILVPINTSYKRPEVEYLLKNADIKTLCFADGYKHNNFWDSILEIFPKIKETPRGNVINKSFPQLKNIVYLGHNKQKGMFSTPELLLLGSHVDDIELETVTTQFDCHSPTLILYTSGTTGHPKGVVLSHHNILNNAFSIGQCMKYTSADKLLLCVPLFNSFGCILGVCSIVTHGATLVFNEEFNANMVLRSVEKEKCTALYGVPTMFVEELNVPDLSNFDLSSLRTGIMSGAPCPIDVMNDVMYKLNNKEIIIVFGLAEASPGVTATRTHNSPQTRSTTIGFELPNVKVKIIDPQSGEECPTNKAGELCCRGYNVFKGYYKNPEATSKTIDLNGWLHTGDLAVKTNDGFYKITGRITDMIIRGGENIYPIEIEAVLQKIPEIKKAAVVGVPNKKYGEEVCAFVVLKNNKQISAQKITEFCKSQMAYFKLPKHIYFIDKLPVSANNRVQKYKLKQLAIQYLNQQDNKS